MNAYEQSLKKFNILKEKFRKQGVPESDLPFLFENRNSDTGFLLLHGSQATPCNTYELGKMLHEKGFTTMGVLLEGHDKGPNGLNNSSVTWEDCYHSAVNSLKILSSLSKKIYIIGSSFGGTLAYLLGIEFKNSIAGVIAISAPTYISYEPPSQSHWSTQVINSIKTVQHNLHNFTAPVLIMHGSDDNVVKVSRAFHAYENVKSRHKKLVIYNEIGHSLGFGSNTREVLNDIINFVNSYSEPVPVRFELEINSARKVTLAGDFNGWNGNEYILTNHNGKWVTEVFLKPGNYQYKFVIDDHKWIPDPEQEKIYTPHGEINSIVRIDY